MSNFLILGGLYLIYAGIIRWHIPIFVLAGLLLPATLLYFIDASRFAGPAFHLFSGGAVLGAFFIATDPVSAAATIRGRVFYGAAIGLLVPRRRTFYGADEIFVREPGGNVVGFAQFGESEAS